MTIRSRSLLSLLAGLVTAILAAVFLSAAPAGAADAVNLGTAGSYGVLAGSAVTNTGPSVINGDVGVSPGTAISGFPPGLVNGATHSADAEALQAKSDLVIAYNDAAGRAADASVATELGGTTLLPGVYDGATLGITGTLTLDAGGVGTAVFIIRAASELTTATDSAVSLINGADPCNVYWQIGSSATLGTRTAFQGTLLAQTSITATTGATVEGRLLARDGAVTLDTNTITRPTCDDDETTTVPGSSSTEGPTTEGPTTTGPVATSAPSTMAPTSTTPAASSTPTTPGSSGSTTSTSTSTTAPTITTTGGGAVPGAPKAPGSPGSPGNPGTPGTDNGTPATSTSLARTGTPVVPAVLIGGAMVLLGLGLVVRSRRQAARIGW